MIGFVVLLALLACVCWVAVRLGAPPLFAGVAFLIVAALLFVGAFGDASLR